MRKMTTKLGFLTLLATGLACATPISIVTSNSPNPSYPYLGGIVGSASTSNDLLAGSYNYVYLGGTGLSSAGAAPQSGGNSFTAATSIAESYESAIWSLGAGNLLTAQWVNADLSTQVTYAALVQGVLVLTGDLTAFRNTFGSADELTFVYVPSGTSGYIEAYDVTTGGTDLGALAASFNVFGEYGAFTSSSTNRLEVILPTSGVPEPATAGFIAAGLALVVLGRKRVRA